MCSAFGGHAFCSRCLCTRYCSPACQRAHWRLIHRGDCRAFAKALGGEGDGLFLPFAVAGEKLFMSMAIARIVYVGTHENEQLHVGVTEASMNAKTGPMTDDSAEDMVAFFVDQSLTRDGVAFPIACHLTARQFLVLADAVIARVDLDLPAGTASGVSSAAQQPFSAGLLESYRAR